jgi:hypothetical protein
MRAKNENEKLHFGSTHHTLSGVYRKQGWWWVLTLQAFPKKSAVFLGLARRPTRIDEHGPDVRLHRGETKANFAKVVNKL